MSENENEREPEFLLCEVRRGPDGTIEAVDCVPVSEAPATEAPTTEASEQARENAKVAEMVAQAARQNPEND